jgi:hypothetical protein
MARKVKGIPSSKRIRVIRIAGEKIGGISHVGNYRIGESQTPGRALGYFNAAPS